MHAVVLDLPTKLCAQQARDRMGHEGNLSGNEAHRVVGQMSGAFRKAGLPSKKEGLASILVGSRTWFVDLSLKYALKLSIFEPLRKI